MEAMDYQDFKDFLVGLIDEKDHKKIVEISKIPAIRDDEWKLKWTK